MGDSDLMILDPSAAWMGCGIRSVVPTVPWIELNTNAFLGMLIQYSTCGTKRHGQHRL